MFSSAVAAARPCQWENVGMIWGSIIIFNHIWPEGVLAESFEDLN